MYKLNDYDSIPGTYVFDARRSRLGYALNMFCMSLNKPENRVEFKADEPKYLQKFTLSAEQRAAVLKRDWLGMLRLGGNIYYTIKIAFCDGLTFQDVASAMSGVSRDSYVQMMLSGGRSPDGNRYVDPPRAQ
jgi:protocatechuate 4,5-dioxygenase alpha chain